MTERDIFLAAIDLPDPAARAAYLDRACAGNPALRGKVDTLLRSHERAGSFLGVPLVAPADPEYAATRDFSGPRDDTAGGTVPDEALDFLAPAGRPDSLGRIGHYEVLQVLGKGAFGIVFRAYDDVLQRVVAVKVLAPQMAATSPARKRFLREARSSAQIRHENVVQVYEVGEQPLPYLVMEFIPGETLQQRLDRTGPVDPAEVLWVGRQIAEGLAAAHAQDLIHRDIKPGNVLIEGAQHKVKITDFGLARAADDASISQSGIIAGTPMYMAPEQARGEHIDHRADLFSLGSVLYQMVTGRPPFRANGSFAVLKRVAEDDPRPIREVIPEAPWWLCEIIAKLHAKNPAERFPSAREVADVLAACEERLKSSTNPHGFPVVTRAPEQRAKRRKWVAASAAVACAAALGLTAYTLTRPGDTAPATAGTAPAPLAPPAPAPKAPPAPDPAIDRRAAVYVMSIGGGVRINGTSDWWGNVGELPKSPFALTSVSLRDKKVTDDGLLLFQGCQNVKHLDLAGTKVTDAGLVHFKDCAGLTHLDLFSTNVTDAGLAHFKACRFTHLSLRSTHVTDATAAAFGHCTELTFLGLAHTKVTEAGLAHFRDCTKLKHLDLDELPVGDAAVAPFAECKDLEVLHLGGAQVTDAGVARFKGCKRLRTLFLRGTRVTAAGIDDLKAALPQCRIEWNGGTVEPTAARSRPDDEVKRTRPADLSITHNFSLERLGNSTTRLFNNGGSTTQRIKTLAFEPFPVRSCG